MRRIKQKVFLEAAHVHFISPTYGKVSVQEMLAYIREYITEDQRADYKVIIGTDSQTSEKETIFVTAVIIQRIGKGARFFYRRKRQRAFSELTHRIYKETELSLQVMESLQRSGASAIFGQWPVEVHLDVGQKGETRKLIQDIVGWVSSVGYTAKIKPHAYGASAVADRYTK
ncbi:ribonuclease H-like YkuK family protein [Bacillaceae bacterium]